MRKRKYMNYAFSEDMHLFVVIQNDQERILIGTRDNVESLLEGNEAEVFFDCTRGTGSWLIALSQYTDDGWGKALDDLNEAYHLLRKKPSSLLEQSKLLIGPSKVLNAEEKAGLFFESKVETDDPINKYVALKIWETYKVVRDDVSGTQFVDFLSHARNLIRVFSEKGRKLPDDNFRIAEGAPYWSWGPSRQKTDNIRMLGTVGTDYIIEYTYADWSLMPIKDYYLHKMESYGKCFSRCKVCNAPFIASTLRSKMCSTSCRELSAKANREKRSVESISAKVDKLSRREYQHWANHIEAAKKSGDMSVEAIENLKKEMVLFRREKNRRNKACRNGKTSYEKLNHWYMQQRDYLDHLLESY